VVTLHSKTHAWRLAVMVCLEEQKDVMMEIWLMVMAAVPYVLLNLAGNAIRNQYYCHLFATRFHGQSL